MPSLLARFWDWMTPEEFDRLGPSKIPDHNDDGFGAEVWYSMPGHEDHNL